MALLAWPARSKQVAEAGGIVGLLVGGVEEVEGFLHATSLTDHLIWGGLIAVSLAVLIVALISPTKPEQAPSSPRTASSDHGGAATTGDNSPIERSNNPQTFNAPVFINTRFEDCETAIKFETRSEAVDATNTRQAEEKPDVRVVIEDVTLDPSSDHNVVAEVAVSNYGRPAQLSGWDMFFYGEHDIGRGVDQMHAPRKPPLSDGKYLEVTKPPSAVPKQWGPLDQLDAVTNKPIVKGEPPRRGFYWAKLSGASGDLEAIARTIYLHYAVNGVGDDSNPVGPHVIIGKIEVKF